MENLTRLELEKLKLFGNRVLIKLPAETDSKNQTLKSGLVASFIYSDKEAYAPVQGIVYKRSPTLEVLRDGDHVFFHYLCWGNANHSDESFKNGHYDGTKIALECEGEKYLLMSDTEIFFAKRGDRYVCMNDYLLLRGIPKDLKEEILRDSRGLQVGKAMISATQNGLVTALETQEPYRLDLAEVAACPDGLGVKAGDIVWPDLSWDIPLEYNILQTLGETLYYVNKEVIFGRKVPVN